MWAIFVPFRWDTEENIFIGKHYTGNVSNASRLREALEIVNLGDLQNRFGNTFSIGQMGSKLSGGQRQRLAVARTVVKPVELYIFDESFNAVDPDTLSLIVPQILKRLKKAKPSLLLVIKQDLMKTLLML